MSNQRKEKIRNALHEFKVLNNKFGRTKKLRGINEAKARYEATLEKSALHLLRVIGIRGRNCLGGILC